MNLKQQLLLVSLLTLVLPWAGYQFIRETESALRSGQQEMLAGTARAIADSLAQYEDEFPLTRASDHVVGDQLYGHRISTQPIIDGYFDDWGLPRASLRSLRGKDGPIQFAIGLFGQSVYLYVEVADNNVVYATPGTIAVDNGSRFADRVGLVNTSPPYLDETYVFGAEAPGPIISYVRNAYGFSPDPTVAAHWQDVPGRGYQLEARFSASKLGTNLGLLVSNTDDPSQAAVRSASFSARLPGAFVTTSEGLIARATRLAQPGMRLTLTEASGWRIATAGDVELPGVDEQGVGSVWLRIVYEALVEQGQEAELAAPDASGREQQTYIAQALDGEQSVSWFRNAKTGDAIVAVAQPVIADGEIIGALVLQQGTDAILSLRSQGLARLMYVTVIATLLAAAALLGYSTWLSRRIRRLSVAAEDALVNDDLRSTLPSALDSDEVGDLSRSFSYVLRQLGDYNEYLRTLASKLSHELRTPLAIVSSSLENLEHEPLSEASADYAARARDGADRLRRILTAMSEASRVEELMQHVEPDEFDLHAVLHSTVAAYRDVYPARQFEFSTDVDVARTNGSPELLIQMLDKLVDNAVEFSADGDTLRIGLVRDADVFLITVSNPGPALPERMRTQLFDSMVSVRGKQDSQHLGLGLYVARLIAEGHNGSISADNIDGGVQFSVSLPAAS
jgi:two-component system, OmpR family, sensor histidine kinase ChvG